MQERLLDYAATVDPHSRPTAVKKLVQEVQYTPKLNPIPAGFDTLAPPEHQPPVPEYKVCNNHCRSSNFFYCLSIRSLHDAAVKLRFGHAPRLVKLAEQAGFSHACLGTAAEKRACDKSF